MKSEGLNPQWLSRCIVTYNYHAKKLKENSRWTLRDTAKSLGRSLGSISEDIILATWYVTDGTTITKFKYAKDALVYCRQRSLKIAMRQIDA